MTANPTPSRRSFLAEIAPVVLAAAAVLLFFGLTLPMLNVTSFWVFTDTHSVIGGIERFWQEGEWLLLAAIGGFAVLFPAAKILVAGWAVVDPPGARSTLKLAAAISKWSMLDVFVVALVVLTVKSTAVADASVGSGAWCFAGAAILSSLAIAGLAKRHMARAESATSTALSTLSKEGRITNESANAATIVIPALWIGLVIGAGFLAVPAIFAGDEAGRPFAYTAAARVFERLAFAEWGLAALTVIALVTLKSPKRRTVAAAMLIAILAVQAIWLQPELAERAYALSVGRDVPPYPAHAIYAGLEICKLAWLIGLAVAGWRSFSAVRNPQA